MSMELPKASAAIDEEDDQEIARVGKRLEQRVADTQERVSVAQQMLTTAKLDAMRAKTKLKKFQDVFSEPADAEDETEVEPATEDVETSAKPPVVPPVARAPKVPAAKAVNIAPAAPSGERLVAAKRAPRAALTVPEQIAAAMGDGIWDAPALAQKLADSGAECFRSNNPRTYVSSILSSARIRVPGPNGEVLLTSEGKPFEVRRFVVLERGRYRVATSEDIDREVRKHLGSKEVIMSDNTTPTDELFAEHGIDVRPAMGGAA